MGELRDSYTRSNFDEAEKNCAVTFRLDYYCPNTSFECNARRSMLPPETHTHGIYQIYFIHGIVYALVLVFSLSLPFLCAFFVRPFCIKIEAILGGFKFRLGRPTQQQIKFLFLFIVRRYRKLCVRARCVRILFSTIYRSSGVCITCVACAKDLAKAAT